jgi:DNA repair photolyase/GNAT superfamily N-acetyltransferase
MEYKEIQVRNILVKCGIPGIDFVINPYMGCRFACKYCYASFMGRFINKKFNDWGNYVFIKINAPELLKKQLAKLKNKGKGEEIFISSVTDPYQGIEAKYKLTRQCLEILADYGFEGVVSILTKSDLVTRDIDVLKRLKKVLVGLTVTSTDDSISRYFETYAPPVTSRLKALKTLNENNIKTYAFIGPLLPHFVAKPEELEKLFQSLKQAETKDIFIEHLNLSAYIRNRLMIEMKGADKKIIDVFYSSQSKEYRKKLEEIIQELVKKYHMHLLMNVVVYHKEFQQRPMTIDHTDELIRKKINMEIKIGELKKTEINEALKLISEVIIDNFKLDGVDLVKFEKEIDNGIDLQRQRLLSFSAKKIPYFLVAKDKGEIIGTIAYGPIDDLIKSGLKKMEENIDQELITELISVYVKTSFQGKGIGSKLLAEIMKLLKKTNYHYISLSTGYIGAKKFWEKKFGKPTVVFEKYFPDYGDCWVWVKKIN